MRNRMPVVAAASALLLGLTACVPTAEIVVPAEPSHAQPVFASDEEALAAAVEVYDGYLQAIQDRSKSGSDDLSALAIFVTRDQLERERAAADESIQSGTRTKGSATFDRFALQQYWTSDDGLDRLIAYLCLDVSEVVVLNAAGVDVTPVDRPSRVALEVEFEVAGSTPEEIQIARSEVWPDQSYCLQS